MDGLLRDWGITRQQRRLTTSMVKEKKKRYVQGFLQETHTHYAVRTPSAAKKRRQEDVESSFLSQTIENNTKITPF